MGFYELIMNTCRDENLNNYLNLMQGSVKRLENFSLEAILITQLSTGMYNVQHSPFRVYDQVSWALSQFEDQLQASNLFVKTDIEDVEIITDVTLVRCTIFNLLENAILHSPNGQEIIITGKCIKTVGYRIKISDRGKGFPREIIRKKYLLFRDQDFTDNRPGFGLYTINLIMKLLRGKLTLYNGLNGGATAMIQLTSFSEIEKHFTHECKTMIYE
jgi:K+-sensing histidine kinase KdpD